MTRPLPCSKNRAGIFLHETRLLYISHMITTTYGPSGYSLRAVYIHMRWIRPHVGLGGTGCSCGRWWDLEHPAQPGSERAEVHLYHNWKTIEKHIPKRLHWIHFMCFWDGSLEYLEFNRGVEVLKGAKAAKGSSFGGGASGSGPWTNKSALVWLPQISSCDTLAQENLVAEFAKAHWAFEFLLAGMGGYWQKMAKDLRKEVVDGRIPEKPCDEERTVVRTCLTTSWSCMSKASLCCKDQYGTRYIQQKLDEAPRGFKHGLSTVEGHHKEMLFSNVNWVAHSADLRCFQKMSEIRKRSRTRKQ